MHNTPLRGREAWGMGPESLWTVEGGDLAGIGIVGRDRGSHSSGPGSYVGA